MVASGTYNPAPVPGAASARPIDVTAKPVTNTASTTKHPSKRRTGSIDLRIGEDLQYGRTNRRTSIVVTTIDTPLPVLRPYRRDLPGQLVGMDDGLFGSIACGI
ncbi:hypothetical protein GCM10009534_35690 [Kribbella sandramycini]